MNHIDRTARFRAWASTDAVECWAYIASMDGFSACDPAEYIRVFPRLLPRDGAVPVALRGHMTRCLAVLALRCRTNGDGAPMAVLAATSGLAAADIAELGAAENDRWFPFHPAVRSEAFAAHLRPADGVVGDLEAFALVNALSREIDAGALRSFDCGSAAIYSFTAGIHAAYLWPEALLSHEFYTAVGWLGHLWRGREARLPGDLAEYFGDVIDLAPDGTPVVRDRLLARFLPGTEIVSEVRRAVLARRDGASAVAAWPGVAPWAAPPGAVPSPNPGQHGGWPS